MRDPLLRCGEGEIDFFDYYGRRMGIHGGGGGGGGGRSVREDRRDVDVIVTTTNLTAITITIDHADA